MADPFPILDVFNKERYRGRFDKAKVVTILDADYWEARETFGPLFYNQLKAADLILLNKIDLQEADNIPLFLQEIQETTPSSSILPTFHCRIDPQVLWGLSIKADKAVESYYFADVDDHDDDHDHDHEERDPEHTLQFVSFNFKQDMPFREECFRRFMESAPAELYRIKGFANFGATRFLVNHVGCKTEWQALDEAGPTKLAFVGWKVDDDEIIAQLQACLK